MLVLSRKTHELVRIVVQPSTEPQVIDVVVAELRGDKVRLGFEADRQLVSISREEVYEAGRLPPGAMVAAVAADAELAGEGEVGDAEESSEAPDPDYQRAAANGRLIDSNGRDVS